MMNASPAPQEIFLLKLGEVVLKGQNRQSFEDKLLANVRRRVKNCGSFQCSLRQSTIYVEPQGEDCDMEAAWDACRQVFGIAAVARAVPCEKTVDAIVEAARTYLADAFAVAKSFKVESKRADKMFPMNSIQLSQAVGGDLAELFPHVAVDVHTPDLTVFVEIREKYAYVHTPSVPGAGGLPIGMGGRAVSLLSGGIDSPVSSWMMARRGVDSLLVTDGHRRYVGTVSIGDIRHWGRELTSIEPLIRQTARTVRVGDEAKESFDYLLDSGANYVVVLNADDTIAGIVTKTSVARSVAENLWGDSK